MKISDILRAAGKRVESRQEDYSCNAIVRLRYKGLIGWDVQQEATAYYKRHITPANQEHLWVDDFGVPPAGRCHRALALYLVADVAESEGL